VEAGEEFDHRAQAVRGGFEIFFISKSEVAEEGEAVAAQGAQGEVEQPLAFRSVQREEAAEADGSVAVRADERPGRHRALLLQRAFGPAVTESDGQGFAAAGKGGAILIDIPPADPAQAEIAGAGEQAPLAVGGEMAGLRAEIEAGLGGQQISRRRRIDVAKHALVKSPGGGEEEAGALVVARKGGLGLERIRGPCQQTIENDPFFHRIFLRSLDSSCWCPDVR